MPFFPDKDQNGSLDVSELGVLFNLVGQPMTSAEIKVLVKSVDKDGDGCVSYDE